MIGSVGRRGFCAAVGVGATAGCIGVLGRERVRVTAVRRSPPNDWSREMDLAQGDLIIVEYNASGPGTSRMVVEDADGVVVFDQTVSEHGTLRYTASMPGTHTVRLELGDSARIDLYHES